MSQKEYKYPRTVRSTPEKAKIGPSAALAHVKGNMTFVDYCKHDTTMIVRAKMVQK